jgi:NAD(P)-dependent dehydrogenase (short-subunit alcohol dehydrogenase family)
MSRLENKIAVVTGGASGLGEACARRFAAEGAKVVIADIDDGAGETLARELGGLYLHTDVSTPAEVERMVSATVEACGRIDILMNNAGIDGAPASTGASDIENWRRVMSINIDGVYYGMRYALPVMVAQGGGVILNTASTVGLNAIPGLPAYAASKAGVVHLSKTAAIEYAAQRIRVNAICPAVVDTPMVRALIANSPNPELARQGFEHMNPMPGLVTAEAVANAALFLVSDESAFITAVALPVDGGYTAR